MVIYLIRGLSYDSIHTGHHIEEIGTPETKVQNLKMEIGNP